MSPPSRLTKETNNRGWGGREHKCDRPWGPYGMFKNSKNPGLTTCSSIHPSLVTNLSWNYFDGSIVSISVCLIKSHTPDPYSIPLSIMHAGGIIDARSLLTDDIELEMIFVAVWSAHVCVCTQRKKGKRKKKGKRLTILKCTGGPPNEVNPRYQFSRIVLARPSTLAAQLFLIFRTVQSTAGMAVRYSARLIPDIFLPPFRVWMSSPFRDLDG